MDLSHAITGLETAVETQLRLAGPEVAEIGGHLMSALQPAIRQSLMDVVSMAATEVSSQLPSQRVEIRLVDGDPELTVTGDLADVAAPPNPSDGDDDEARITVRLPAYLKDLISEAASMEGDSVNAFVVDSLRVKTQGGRSGATRHRGTIEL
jgi:hypothetical protein